MPRALFVKTGNAAYISHLDLMRLFQRSFKRAGFSLTHTKGYNPRPSVSIALPLSLGVESYCELLDFELEGQLISADEIKQRLNSVLVDGVRVVHIYNDMNKIKYLSLLACDVTLEYDTCIPTDAVHRIAHLFSQQELLVEKKSKNGITEQNIAPMIREISAEAAGEHEIVLHALVCCQNPSLNPAQLGMAICKYLPDLTPDFVRICRKEIFDNNKEIFR